MKYKIMKVNLMKHKINKLFAIKKLVSSFKDNISSVDNNIFQTHESIDKINDNKELVKATTTWNIYNKQFNYIFHNKIDRENFIKRNFDNDVYQAFCKLPLGVMKADFWRYCVIYHYGGIYADSDTICMVNPSIFQKNAQMVVVPEFEPQFCQWVFAAPKKTPFLKSVIDLMVEKVKLWDGKIENDETILSLTGPHIFTEGIENYLKSIGLPTYQNRIDYENYQEKVNPILYVFPRSFHENIVKHFYTGFAEDGWKNEVKNFKIYTKHGAVKAECEVIS
jgi:mannosyltransferase OCH1-like enzyme